MDDKSKSSDTMPAAQAAPRPRLRELLHQAMRRLHYSRRTEKAYAHWIKRFILFSGKRHPEVLGEAKVTAFLNHLAAERKVAAATQNQALSAILFLCTGRCSGANSSGWTACSARAVRRACPRCSRARRSNACSRSSRGPEG